MTDKEILNQLWDAHRETPFTSFSLQRKLDLRHDALRTVLNLLNDMADSGEVRSGYRIKRVASTMYKLISQAECDSDPPPSVETAQAASTAHKATQAQPSDGDTLKGLPLTDPQESLTGANTASFHEQLPENADFSINDPFPAVPAELKARRQWVCGRAETRDGKPTKIPYQTIKRKGEYLKAQTNQADTWTDYQTVCDHLDDFSGIGFVFSEDDPYCGIDFDDCLDAQDKVKDWAKPIMDRFKSVAYRERSPGGKGGKIWTRATLPPEAKHKVYIVKGADAIEAYDRLRYFTVTGKGKATSGTGKPLSIGWCRNTLANPNDRHKPQGRLPSATENLNAGEVIERIRASRQSAKFDALMRGNTTGYGSQSEADLALCGVITSWSQETAVIDAIFRQSALMRAKWDEKHRADGSTYGQMTIKEALSGNRETHTRPRQARTTNKRHARRERYGYDRF